MPKVQQINLRLKVNLKTSKTGNNDFKEPLVIYSKHMTYQFSVEAEQLMSSLK